MTKATKRNSANVSGQMGEKALQMLRAAGFKEVSVAEYDSGLLPRGRYYVLQYPYKSPLFVCHEARAKKRDALIDDCGKLIHVEVKTQNSSGSTYDKVFRYPLELLMQPNVDFELLVILRGTQWQTESAARQRVRAMQGPCTHICRSFNKTFTCLDCSHEQGRNEDGDEPLIAFIQERFPVKY